MQESYEEAVAETGSDASSRGPTADFQLDHAKLSEQVSAIVESDYFQNLLLRAKELRENQILG